MRHIVSGAVSDIHVRTVVLEHVVLIQLLPAHSTLLADKPGFEELFLALLFDFDDILFC